TKKTVPRTAAIAFGVFTSIVSPGFIFDLTIDTAIRPLSISIVDLLADSVTVKIDNSRIVSKAFPPIKTLTMDSSPVLILSPSRTRSLYLREREEWGVEAWVREAFPVSPVTVPAGVASWAHTSPAQIAGKSSRVQRKYRALLKYNPGLFEPLNSRDRIFQKNSYEFADLLG